MATAGHKIRMLLTSTIATVLVFWAGWMIAVLVWSTLDQARPAESIVVLGAAQYDGRPSPVLRARLDHAVDLWNRHLAHVVILTGGRGFGDTTSEAAVGRGYGGCLLQGQLTRTKDERHKHRSSPSHECSANAE